MAELKYFSRVSSAALPQFVAALDGARVRIDGQIGYIRGSKAKAIGSLPRAATGFGVGGGGSPEVTRREYVEVEMHPNETEGTTRELGEGWAEISRQEFIDVSPPH